MKHLSRIFVALLALQAPAALGATISQPDISVANQDLINSPTGADIGLGWQFSGHSKFQNPLVPSASKL